MYILRFKMMKISYIGLYRSIYMYSTVNLYGKLRFY